MGQEDSAEKLYWGQIFETVGHKVFSSSWIPSLITLYYACWQQKKHLFNKHF